MTTPTPTSPEAAPAPEAAPVRTVRQMLDETEGFGAWLKTEPHAKSVQITEANLKRITELHEAFEAGKLVGEDIRNVCNEHLAGHDAEQGVITAISEEELARMNDGIRHKAMENPRYMAGLRKTIEDFGKLPAAIAAKEQEIAALQQKAAALAGIARERTEALTRKGELKAKIDAPSAPKTRLGKWEFVKYQFFTQRSDEDFRAEIDALTREGSPKSIRRRQSLERMRKVAKEANEFLQKDEWRTELAGLEARIAELEANFTGASAARASIDRLTEETNRTKATIQKMRQEIFASVLGSKEIHTRAAKEIHTQLAEAYTSEDLEAKDKAVAQLTRLEEIAKKEGVKSNYLTDFPANLRRTVDQYKTELTDQIKVLLQSMLETTLRQMYPGQLYGAFERDLEEFLARGTKGVGFENEAKSRAFVIAELEAQQRTQQDPQRIANLEYLISELKRSGGRA